MAQRKESSIIHPRFLQILLALHRRGAMNMLALHKEVAFSYNMFIDRFKKLEAGGYITTERGDITNSKYASITKKGIALLKLEEAM